MTQIDLDTQNVPRHIAIIMDGNGRWAKKRALARIRGHRAGMESVKTVVRTCSDLGVEVLTLYAFSTENWFRPRAEVSALMMLLKTFIKSEVDELHRNRIRLNAIGNIERLPKDVNSLIRKSMAKTGNNTGMVLNVALSYGGREEILMAVTALAQKAATGQLDAAQIDERLFAQHLYTADMPDPDLLIRTSGELRISNFLLWQIAYTELYVTDVLWPDFRKEETLQAIAEYQKRKRRFGRTDEQLTGST